MVSLYLIQAATTLLPLLTIPFLTRALGVTQWGTLAYFQSQALFGGLLIEYGFALSATRSISRNRGSAALKSTLLADITGAKCILALVVGLLLFSTYLIIPFHRDNPFLLLLTFLWAVAQGLNYVWYFQGIANLRLLAIIDIAFRGSTMALMFALVRKPGDLTLSMLLFVLGVLCSTIISGLWIYRREAVRLPSLGHSVRTLRDGLSLFVARTAISLFTTANGFILGIFAPPLAVGIFAAAERISKGVLVVNGPLNQTMYAHINHQMSRSDRHGEEAQRRNFLVMTGSGLFLGFCVFAGAPFLVRLLFGSQFAEAVTALRLLALTVPLISLATALGSHCMLPLGFDNQFTKIVLGAAALNICLAALLAPQFHQIGMCIAVVCSEAFVAICAFVFLHLHGHNPLLRQRAQHATRVAVASEAVRV